MQQNVGDTVECEESSRTAELGTSSTISPLPCEETKLEANRRRKLENDKKMQQDRERREMRLQRKTASIAAKSDPVACMKKDSASSPACCPGCGKSDGDIDEYGSHLAEAVDDMAVAVDVETVVEDEDVSQSEVVEGTSTYTSFLVNVCPF